MILLLSLTGCQSEEGGGSADPPVSGITGAKSPALDNSSAETSGTEATDRSPIRKKPYGVICDGKRQIAGARKQYFRSNSRAFHKAACADKTVST